ncbi:4118_t:CDS:2, partial [Racocetra fulgida]
FLSEDHNQFSSLNVSLKSILSTKRTSITLSKNSVRSFYKKEKKVTLTEKVRNYEKKLKDDCLTDAQNCDYFKFFNRKEKRLYTRFLDKIEANFEGTEAKQPALFLTLTFNTTQDNLYAFTTNADPNHDVDPHCETKIILLRKMRKEDVSNYEKASQYLTKFLRNVLVIAELQKNGVWHFHLLSTPLIPYSHKCCGEKNFASCWNCRVESRTPGKKTVGQYLAKYLAKSFHLRSLYRQHGFKEHNKAYRFFKNLYDYEEREAAFAGKGKFDKETQERLNGNQQIFRRYDYKSRQTSYFYRTNEKQTGEAAQPFRRSKNFRLSTSLNYRNLAKLARK